MKFKEFYLLEHTQALYHATHINQLYEMFKDDAIKLIFSSEADTKVNMNKYFYLSAMTVKYGKFAEAEGHEVVIDLNGTSISNVAKIKNVSYWGEIGKDEQEERIAMDKPKLSPLSKYINSIHIYIRDSDMEHTYLGNKLFYINDNAKRLGVNVYFYEEGNKTAFKMQRTERAITDLTKLIDKPNIVDNERYKLIVHFKDGTHGVFPYYGEGYTKSDAENQIQYYESDEVKNIEIKNVLDLDIPESDKYDSEEQKIIDLLNVLNEKPLKFHEERKFRYGLRKPYIMGYIKNIKRKHSPILYDFVNEMKKHKFRNDEEFIDFILTKNYKYIETNYQ